MAPDLIDLHTHTLCSDGLEAPAALVERARDRGLRGLAITDHDTVEGLAEGRAAGAACGIEVIPGVELSVRVLGEEVHMLAYMFDPEHTGLRAYLADFRVRRYDRARAIVERLHALGRPVPFEAVLAQARGGVLGRPHVARALVAEGYVASYEEAFADYLRDGRAASVPKALPEAAEAMRLIHEAGGITALAHPGHWTREATLMALIREGMDGIETVHPSHDESLTRYYRQVAREFVLLETGGSDYHGFRPDDATGFGRYGVSSRQADRIRRAARERAARGRRTPA